MTKEFLTRACAALALSVLAGCEIGVERAPEAASQTAPAVGQSVENGQGVARGHLRFIDGYQQGYEQAARQGKPMLVFFTASWCHFCHQMAGEAFTHPRVVSLSENFVCILVDADAEPAVCQQFQVTGYPTVQFISPRGVPLARMVGKKPGNQLLIAMQTALQNVARRSGTGEQPTAR